MNKEMPDQGYVFLTSYFERTEHNKYTTTMLRRRTTASYSDCKSTHRGNLVHKIRKEYPNGKFEDQEYFHIHKPLIDRAIAQSVRYWYEDIHEFDKLIRLIRRFYQENLVEGSDTIRIENECSLMHGNEGPESQNGYVILNIHTNRMKKAELEQVVKNGGFINGANINGFEPREYGYLRYPDVPNPTGAVFKYWYEGMNEKDVHKKITEVEQNFPDAAQDTGRIIFARDIRSHHP